MSGKAKILGSLLLLLVSISLQGQTSSDVRHFLDLFRNKNHASLEGSLRAANLRLEQAREIGDARQEAGVLKELGILYLGEAHDYEKAMDLLTRTLAIEDSLRLESDRVLTYLAIARVFEAVGDDPKSGQFLEQALNINRENRDINVEAVILNSLGKVSASTGRIQDAFDYYRKVLTYREDLDPAVEAEALFNMAHLFSLRGDYTEALVHHKKALAVTRAVKDRYFEAQCLNDIGILYGKMNNYAKSLANHQVALEIRESLGDKAGMAESHNNLGAACLASENASDAIEHGHMALELGRESQAREQIFKSYELLSQTYKGLADYNSALRYKELSLAIYEFIQTEKQERQILETQNRYVVGKKESEIERLELLRRERDDQIAAQDRFKNILFIVVGLICVIAGLLLILYLVKRRANRVLQVAKNEVQKQNLQLQELVHTKDKFFSIISHDVKGPLNSLSSFSRLLMDHTDSLSREEIQMLARDLDKSLKNLFTLLENLLEWSRAQTGNIDFTPEVFDLRDILQANKNLLESQANNKQISIVLEGAAPCLVKMHKHSINTVVRNLVSNAIKFTKSGGQIRLRVDSDESQASFSVIDDGVGMTPEVMTKLFRIDQKHSTTGTASEKGTGLGLILCREFIEKNGGTISVDSRPEKGSTFTCRFPPKVRVNTPSGVAAEATF